MQVRESLKGVSADERATAARQVVSILLGREEFLRAGSVLVYLALRDELDLAALVTHSESQGKTIALPRFDSGTGVYHAAVVDSLSTLVKGQFGIMEPPLTAPLLPLNALDFILVPGLAFDPAGRRLGRGKGFYDRLLAQTSGLKCGIALDAQIIPVLPAEPHDIKMDFILTPSGWFIPSREA